MPTLLMAALLAATAFSSSTGDEKAPWITSLADAQKTAKAESKLILADFTGSNWCGWCMKLKAEVFTKQEFIDWAAEKVVLLEVDFPRKTPQPEELKLQNVEMLKKYKVDRFPTILFLDADGKEVGRTNYVAGGPAAWLKAAEAQMKEKPEANQGNEAATTEGAAGWITDYEAALQRAKTEKKVILADFTGSDWCGWCKRLQAEVFTKKEFQQWAAKNVVLLELDFPHKPQSDALRQQNQKLLREHNVTGYPTIVFLDAKGKKIGQTGYVEGGPSAWIKAAEMEMKK